MSVSHLLRTTQTALPRKIRFISQVAGWRGCTASASGVVLEVAFLHKTAHVIPRAR